MMASLIAGILAAGATTWPGDAVAHGTAHRLLQDAPAVALEFMYSDQTPMRYAEVLVYAPRNMEVEHQNGRTDRHGKFIFAPDAEGQWVVKVTDGVGHAEEASISVGPELIAGRAAKSQALDDTDTAGFGAIHQGLKAVTGVSLILNLIFAGYFLKRRSFSSGR